MKNGKNAKEVLNAVNNCIAELEGMTSWADAYNTNGRIKKRGYAHKSFVFMINDVCQELSIFDWWHDTLSMAQLKQMKKFLEQAIQLGFSGYVCFKVGAAGCSHGMWAYKKENTTGYSPSGDCLFHSFRSGDNYWDAQINGVWMHEKYATVEDSCPNFTIKQIKAELRA